MAHFITAFNLLVLFAKALLPWKFCCVMQNLL